MRKIHFIACLFFCPAMFGQHLFSFGVKGGVPLTDPLSSTTFTGIDSDMRVYSSSKNYAIGPMAGLKLPFGLEIEADALYRPLDLTIDTQILPLNRLTRHSENISSMEFPILLKSHFLPLPVVKPYVEAGPTFRYVGSKVPYLSNTGFALGAGVDVKVLVVRIAPELRYSHWGSDGSSPLRNVSLPPSNQSQVEFLIGLSF